MCVCVCARITFNVVNCVKVHKVVVGVCVTKHD